MATERIFISFLFTWYTRSLEECDKVVARKDPSASLSCGILSGSRIVKSNLRQAYFDMQRKHLWLERAVG